MIVGALQPEERQRERSYPTRGSLFAETTSQRNERLIDGAFVTA